MIRFIETLGIANGGIALYAFWVHDNPTGWFMLAVCVVCNVLAGVMSART